MRLFSRLMFVVLLSGCAVGNQYDYRSSSISLPLKATRNAGLILSVQDFRPYVQNGSKPANFVGLQRGGFGNPFTVTTSSGKPLAEDMAIAIARALSEVGYRVQTVPGTLPLQDLSAKAQGSAASRIVLLNVNEWKSDIFMSITVHCALVLKILNPAGAELAESSMKFEEEIGGAQMGGSKNSSVVSREFAKRIGYLFNKEEIRAALSL
ncbi:hypothetical protein [Pelobacter seleniigenes]|uniref:hypothetical protein n=1 Tax=Pelobacter seleniigenes TaxID=407188 RepID=UPI0004A73748|nr:hypothetical protein [Pelobacter seleniigenes]